MRTKLLIKFYLLLFVIDFLLIWIRTWSLRWIYLALLNLVGLFVLLIAHRKLFQSVETHGQRILFSPDVFARVAAAVGIWSARRWSSQYTVACPRWIVAIMLGALFYVVSVRLFGMRTAEKGHISLWRIALGLLLVGGLFWLINRGVTRVTGDDLKQHYLSLTAQRQDGLQSIVVDEHVRDSQVDAGLLAAQEGLNPPTPQELPEPTEAPVKQAVEDAWAADRVFVVPSDASWNLTYGTFLPVLKESYQLEDSTTPYTFTTVSSTSELYDAFATARDYFMIWSATSPASQLRCQNVMVLAWLAEKRPVAYTPTNVLSVFWEEAVRRGYTSSGCETPLTVARWEMLP